MALFRANTRSYGEFNPKKKKELSMRTIKEEVGEVQFSNHLSGKLGLGVVPIRDDGMCWWGAIDIDNHGKSEDLDLVGIEAKIKSQQLPLIVCRSKSGGAHLYIFFNEPVRADILKAVLTKWMSDLQLEGSDCVFPKQTKLMLNADGGRPLGNWINLPYFNCDNTDRYAIQDGEKLTLDLFLLVAESNALTKDQLNKYATSEHSEAPPCIQHALKDKVSEGSRNDALFHITIYNRKRSPENARELSHDMQNAIFDNPLPFAEADRTIRSAARKTYGYMCKKEPWSGWCDKEACRKVKYGISESEYDTLTANSKLPLFSDLVKYLNTDPVMWEIKMNGVPITLSSEELMDYRVIKVRAMEKLHMILPSSIKSAQWVDEILSALMQDIRVEEAPEEAGHVGVLHIRLHEFLRKADLTSSGRDTADRLALMRGMPVVQMKHEEKVVMFRSIDYEDYLKRTKTDIPRNKSLWYKANKELGVKFDRIRIKQQVIPIWYIGVSKIVDTEFEPIDHNPEY